VYFQRVLAALKDMTAIPERRGTADQISAAIRLGWRVAKLHSLRASALPEQPPGDLLPMRKSLPRADRIALELRATAGDAEQLGVKPGSHELSELSELARRAAVPGPAEARFRARICSWHTQLVVALWAQDEATGKAYELGSFLSDTWNRVVLARNAQSADVTAALRDVFEPDRVTRIHRLLDDLQTRIDPAAVRLVQGQLAAWREALLDCDGDLLHDANLDALHSQVVTWSQLVTGDKEPEAFIGHDDRIEVRERMGGLMLRTFRRHWPAFAVAVPAIGGAAYGIASIPDTEAIVAIVGSIAGTFGVKGTSILLTIRKAVDAQAELVWNTSLVEVINERTLLLPELWPKQPCAAERKPVQRLRNAVSARGAAVGRMRAHQPA
jgi:hypothetical protein